MRQNLLLEPFYRMQRSIFVPRVAFCTPGGHYDEVQRPLCDCEEIGQNGFRFKQDYCNVYLLLLQKHACRLHNILIISNVCNNNYISHITSLRGITCVVFKFHTTFNRQGYSFSMLKVITCSKRRVSN